MVGIFPGTGYVNISKNEIGSEKKNVFSRGDVSYTCVHFRAFWAFFRVFFCVFAAFSMKKQNKYRVCRSRHIRTPHMVHAYFIYCNTIGIYT